MTIFAYDLEIKNEINDLPNKWADHHLMGISVLCVFNGKDFSFYDDNNFEDFLGIYKNPEVLLVSYNGLQFDNKVIEANWCAKNPRTGTPCENPITKKAQELDLLKEIWDSLGTRTHGANGLDKVGSKTVGYGKSGAGEHAPILYKQGRFAELFTYCMHDVKLTWDVFQHARKYGFVTNGHERRVELPELRSRFGV